MGCIQDVMEAVRKQTTPLHLAAEGGHADIVQNLILNGANVDACNNAKMTALHLACRNGHTSIVLILLDKDATVDVTDQSEKTPLHLAAERGHAEIVQNLILNGANVNACNTAKMTPLHLACQKGNTAIVEILLENHVTVDVTDQSEKTPLHLAAERGHAEIVQNLILNYANVNACNKAKMTPLHLACQNGHTSIVEILLDNHATVDIMKQSEETPFYLAAKNGHADIADLLIRRGLCHFMLTKDIQTPLKVAVDEGNTDVVEVILEHSRRISEKLTKDGGTVQENTKRGVIPVYLFKSDGRSVSAEIVWTERYTPLEIRRDSHGDIPLKQAVCSNDPEMVQLILSVDQRLYSETQIATSFRSIICRDYRLNTYLNDDIQWRKNLTDIAQYLINSSKFNVNHQDRLLNTFLHYVIDRNYGQSSSGHLTEESNLTCLQIINYPIQFLLEKGADFNMKNSYGETPLIIASENNNYQAIQVLFDWEQKSGKRLDIDARDRYGATALIKAAERNHVSVVQMLLNYKASANMHDYYGFTALHAAIYEPNENWFDLHFFSKRPRERNFCGRRLQNYHEHKEKITRFTEEIVKLLLDNDQTNVNAIDFRGDTPLDLAVKSFKRINSAILKALKNRGAIRNSKEPEDEAPIEVARVDERGRNPLHRLAISGVSGYAIEDMKVADAEQDHYERLGLMVDGILLTPEKFRETATATDNKERTPLHYAVRQQPFGVNQDLLWVLFKLGSNVNAADMYSKTPLHYAEKDERYKLLVQYGAKENIKDETGHTPRDLKQLRESVTINKFNGRKLPIGKQELCASTDIKQLFNQYNMVTELTKRKVIETIRIFSQSPRPQESSEEAIWKIWTENEIISLNRRLSQLKPLIQHFIEHLANGVTEKDWRFECQPILVGSAEEETKAVISADFDFNFKLIKFNQLCDPFPHPLGPKGYFQLRRKPKEDTKSRSDGNFACFFNLDQYLLTNEVNSRFQILVKKVLEGPSLWQDEHLFECIVIDVDIYKSLGPAGLCKTLRLKMINPIEDGDGGFVFVDVSVDIVACVHVEDWCSEDSLPVGISPSVKANGSTFVFDGPYFSRRCSETFARISFAPLESRVIRESSLLIKAAYIVCKMKLCHEFKTTYQLKTCLLFCMEAFNARYENKTRNEDEITPNKLLFWVERIMFCFMEFSRHDVFPCYFMPSFRQRVAELSPNYRLKNGTIATIRYSAVYDIYLDICPDNTAIDIPMDQYKHSKESAYANCDPNWEQFNREKFIRKLSSRNFY